LGQFRISCKYVQGKFRIPVIDDPEPTDEDLPGDDPRDEMMTLDSEPNLALSPQ
jgi:hypothetical protein